MEHSKDSQTQPLSLQNRYDFEFKNDGYVFRTETGTEYIVTFLDYSLFIDTPIQVYHFAFYKTKDGVSNNEENKVRNTILQIIINFFEEHERAIIAFCDTDDGRQMSRQKLFNRWYSSYSNIISKAEALFTVDKGLQTYAVLYYREDDWCAKELAEQFNELAKLNFYH